MNAPLRHPVAVLKERPFDGRLRVLKVDWVRSPSIAEILDAQQDVPQSFREQCAVRVIDELVPREMWRYVRPKPCCIRDGKVIDVVVTFYLPLGNPGGGSSGGGAKKNPVATVATIAVLLAATVVSAGALGPVTGGFLAAGTVGASVLGAGVGIGGGIEVSALTGTIRP